MKNMHYTRIVVHKNQYNAIGTLISIIILLNIIQSAYANNFARQEQIKIFVRCEALHNTTAEVLSQSEDEYKQHPLHKEALNSGAIVLEYVDTGHYDDVGLGDLYLEYKNEFEELYRKNENDPQRVRFLKALDSEISSCQNLNELQKDIIDRNQK